MKRMVYTREDGGVSIVTPAAKSDLEKVTGPMTDAEYEAYVIERSIPEGVKYRLINESDIPASREFRNAWVDKSADSCIDICCEKAKSICLEKLRAVRNKELDSTDIDMTRALEDNDQGKVTALRTRRQDLRKVTEPLKAIDAAGKINDEALLAKIKELSQI